jgi:hypothetical protein
MAESCILEPFFRPTNVPLTRPLYHFSWYEGPVLLVQSLKNRSRLPPNNYCRTTCYALIVVSDETRQALLRAISAAPKPLNQASIARVISWPGQRQKLKEILDALVEDGSLERLPSAPRFVRGTQRGWTGYRYRIAQSP